MNSHNVALIIAIFAFAPGALSESSCAAGENAQGACLLQSHSLEGQTLLVKEDESDPADDLEEEFHEEEDEDVDTPDEEESATDDESSLEPSAEDKNSEETSALQSNATAGQCRNDYGDNRGRALHWNQIVGATSVGGTMGAMKNLGYPGTTFYSNLNVCAKYMMNNHYSSQWLGYACQGSTKGKFGPCKSKKGVNVDCYNGLCAHRSNIKHGWSAPLDGVGCHKIDGLGGVGNRDRPYMLQLKDAKEPSGKPAPKLVDPNCKVLCESIPRCTGFTFLKAKKKPACYFFGGVSQASAEQAKTTGASCQKGKCCAHRNYATYFVTRKR